MKKKGLLTIFSISMFGLLISTNLLNKESNYNDLNIKDKEYIILFNSKSEKANFLNEISTYKKYIDIKKDYSGLIDGYVVSSSSSLSSYLSSKNGISVFEENKIIASVPSTTYDSSKVYTTPLKNNSKVTMDVPSESKEGEGTLIAVLDTSFTLDHNAFTNLSSSTKKKLSKSDVDTIVKDKDFAATNLSSYYYNDKIPYYHDYGGKVSGSSLIEDNNVESAYSAHGMHVASIATANGSIYQGIASAAQLAFMKISAESGKSEVIRTESYLSALNDCYLLDVDVINMSFGAALSEDIDEATQLAINKLKDKGVVIAVAAGNDGKGNWAQSGVYQTSTLDFVNDGTIGTMNVYEGVTSVASANVIDDDALNSSIALSDGTLLKSARDQVYANRSSQDTITLPNLKFSTLIDDDKTSISLEYVMVPGIGKESDYDNIDVKGKIAVIKRGESTFLEKIRVASSKGAIACIIGNNVDNEQLGILSFDKSINFIPTMSIELSDYNLLENEENKVITITKNLTSSFSSEGTNDKLEIVNDISSIGQNVAGAYNLNSTGTSNISNGYVYMDGTSMASPNYAGAAALIIGEQEFDSEEDELEYKESLLARTMSTASIIYESEDVPVSVRKQGAGIVDVSKAIESDIYLSGNTSDGAKIELKNNDDIKNGNINLNFSIHNENKKKGTYKAKLLVTTNDTTTYNSDEYKDVLLKKDSSQSLGVKEFDISLSGEELQEVSLSYSLSDEIKSYLDETFTSGTFIEGYVVLTSDDSSFTSLSIPYMGFYGDYNKVDAVEPFTFERDENKTYASDLLNNLCKVTGIKKTNANFNSLIAVTNADSKGSIDGVNDVIKTDANPTSIYMEVSTSLDENGKYHIYAGRKGVSDTLYIQQFVNRTVEYSDVNIINSNGETVLEDHMFDSLYGGDDNLMLYKSVALTTLFGSTTPEEDKNYNYVAHRAYTILSLKSDNHYYEDGTYTLKFTYHLMDGSVQEKEYVLEIGEISTGVASVKNSIINEDEIILYFDKEISKATINGSTLGTIEKEDGLYKVTFNISSLYDELYLNGGYFNVMDTEYNNMVGIITSKIEAILISTSISKNYSFKFKDTSYSDLSDSTLRTITIYDGGKVAKFNGTYTLILNMGKEYQNSDVKAYNYEAKTLKEVDYNFNNGVLTINGVSKSFVIQGKKSSSINSSTLFIICGVSAGVIILGVLGTTLVLTLKKKRSK